MFAEYPADIAWQARCLAGALVAPTESLEPRRLREDHDPGRSSVAVVSITERGGRWVLSLDHAPVNAIDLQVVSEAERAIAKACVSESCTSLVITGSGRVFSAGIDVQAIPNYDPDQLAEMIRCANRTVRAIYGAPIPTVAAVNGHALGAGLVLALACDVRVAAEGTYDLGLTEARVGVPFPACAMEVVRAELPPDALRELVLGADVVAPSSRRAAWFLDRVVSADTLIDEALAEAARRTSLPAYAAVKAQLRARVLARMDEIIENDDDPLTRAWI